MKQFALLLLCFDLTIACTFEKKTENNQSATALPSTADIKLLPDSTPQVNTATRLVAQETPALPETLALKQVPKRQAAQDTTKFKKITPSGKKLPDVPVKPGARGVMTNTALLNKNLRAASSGNLLLSKAVEKAITNGYKALQQPIQVITTKTYMVDTDDKHNFNTVAPYWHQQPDGSWEKIDGKGNGLSKKIGDTEKLQKGIGKVVPDLALAYVASSDPVEKEKFAARAIEYCQQFFLDPATRMNPNLDYAQLIPGKKKIRIETAVEGEKLVDIVDALLLLQTSKHYTPEFDRQIRKWFADMADWMANSPTGKQADKRTVGNIGVIYESMRAAFAIYGGDTSYARQRLPRIKERLSDEMNADGGLEHELDRAKPNMYSNKALQAWVRLARILSIQGINLWTLEEDGKSLEKAILFMVPYMLGEKKMNNTEKIQPNYFRKVARTAQYAYRDHPKTVQELERFLVKYDQGFREGYDPSILTEPYLPWQGLDVSSQ
ncbi:alginate lyase family protein [Adhaeribacter swui]|uniref:Alginate lyase family protein n=1 Tax=Adhaeribacter swui TaxID=2086471 RepID=A0A7G7GEQ8_9BACT|nr:alginate lyase family protein [Adhaeribacter swui]QNF35642.1 alginate lyase family protein [Adhaeribacter swui]